MKAESALAFFNLFAVQRTLYHAPATFIFRHISYPVYLLVRIRFHFALDAKVTDENKDLVYILFPMPLKKGHQLFIIICHNTSEINSDSIVLSLLKNYYTSNYSHDFRKKQVN